MSNQTQPKTIADLDALQKSLNPAHLDRLPRPHNLLAADVADNLASEIGDLADDLEAQANLWRVADLTAAGCGLWDDLRDYLPADVCAKYDRAIAVANRALATSGRLATRCDMMAWHGRPLNS